MKSVLISIRPQWCEMIANGRKTVEVRKTRPKLETPFKCYIYCTYGQGLIEYKDPVYPNRLIDQKVSKDATWGNCCNGKVIGEFVCDEIKRVHFRSLEKETICALAIGNGNAEWYKGSCVSYRDAFRYLRTAKKAYAWHISDLVIYDTPKELSEFRIPCREYEKDSPQCGSCDFYHSMGEYPAECGCDGKKPIIRPPQSWCYAERR